MVPNENQCYPMTIGAKRQLVDILRLVLHHCVVSRRRLLRELNTFRLRRHLPHQGEEAGTTD